MSTKIIDDNYYWLNKENFSKLCTKENLNYPDVANMLSISTYTFYNYTKNRTRCPKNILEKLATLFNVPVNTLIKDVKKPAKKPVNNKKVKYVGPIDYKKIEDALNKKNVSFSKMAKITNISSCYQTKLATGGQFMKEPLLQRMCDYLDIRIEDVIDHNPPQINKKDNTSKIQAENIVEDNNEAETAVSEENNNAIEAVKAEVKILPIEAAYKEFRTNNVMEMLNILNRNILALGKAVDTVNANISVLNQNMHTDYTELTSYIDANVDVLKENITECKENAKDNFQFFKEVLKEIENRGISANKGSGTVKKITLYTNEPQAAVKYAKETVTDESLDVYKEKINTMITFISKKKDHVWSQVAHDINKEFESTYGENITALKRLYAATNNKAVSDITVAEVIYDNPIYRNIYYNMISNKVIDLAS